MPAPGARPATPPVAAPKRALPSPLSRLARAVLGPPLRQEKPDRVDELGRILTRRFRSLPDFLIVGTQKGGTTSLFLWLIRHPHVARPIEKEIGFFDRWFVNGPLWYRAHFPGPIERAKRRRTGLGFITGEATPDYFSNPKAAGRVAALIPRAKIIVLLRDPVDRAYSLYQHHVSQGIETLSFDDAIEAEPERLRGEVERIMTDDSYGATKLRAFSYVGSGIYADQLEEWFAHFPREQALVVKSEHLFAEPSETYARVLDFLGVERVWEPHWYHPINAGEYEPMREETRHRLQGIFGPHNRRLASLIGPGFDWGY